jgi:hypothetical protein
MENTIDHVADFIKRYKSVANVTFTLGKYTDEFGFEKHIFQEEKYKCILDLLNSNPNWENKDENNYEKFNMCPYKIIDTIVYKIKNSPYDLIVTAESKKTHETYISEDYIKKELLFLRKCHTFHLDYENSVSHGNLYIFKLKLHNNSNPDTYNSHSSLLKIIDIIKAVDLDNSRDYVFEKL